MTRTLIVIGILLVLLGVAIWYFSNIFIYLTISLVLSTILGPITNQVNRIQLFGGHIPRFLSALIAFVLVVIFITLFVILFIPLISEQIEVISALDFNKMLDNILGPIRSFELFLIENNLTDRTEGFIVDGLRSSLFDFAKNINFTQIINQLISFTGSFFIGTLAVTFITFFLLYERGIVRRVVISLIPNQYFEVFIAALYKVEKLLSNYLLGLLFQMFSIFSIASIGLTIMGVNYALTIAVFAAVANLIPYLGPILGAIFGIAVGITTTGNFELTNATIILVIKIVSVFAVVQATDNIILQPLIFSKSVKAHPLEIFVIIFVGATIAQIPGMIAAIPAYTIIRVSTAEIYSGFKRYKVFKN